MIVLALWGSGSGCAPGGGSPQRTARSPALTPSGPAVHDPCDGPALRDQAIPAIGTLSFNGATSLPPRELSAAAALPAGSHVDAAAIREAARRVRDVYVRAGYLKASVEPHLQTAAPVNVCLRVEEGPLVVIEQWRFPGAHAMSEDQLRAQMSTHGGRFNVEHGTYRGDLWDERDVLFVRALYLDHGFASVQIGEPNLAFSPDGRRVTVSVPVHEGPIFRVGDVTITGDTLPRDADRALVRTRPGDVFCRRTTAEDAIRIRAQHDDLGRSGTDVTEVMKLDEARELIHVEFRIEAPRRAP